MELRPDSRTYDGWKKPPIPLYLDIYLFNWTNPEDIKNSSTKPIVKQIGPYRFRDYPDKHNISFHDNNSTVSYRKFSTYFFESDMSNGTLDDIITTVNMVAIGAGSTAKNWSYLMQLGVTATLNSFKQKLHVVKTVREILFEGYTDPILTLGSMFNMDSSGFGSVGFMVNKNASDFFSGKYTVHTGVDDISQLGKIKKHNDKTVFPHAQGECRKLKGSPGEFYPPGRDLKEIVYLFTPEMCRSLPYEYHENKAVHGIQGTKYILGTRAIDNGTLHPENKCYFQRDFPSGVWNNTDCSFGQPMYVSYPHFYLADPSYTEAVDGLSPQKELHESSMTLDNKLSITLETTARMQMNVLLEEYGYIGLFKKVPKILMPLFFVEQKFRMNEEQASELYFGLLIFEASKYFGGVLILLGVLFIICRTSNCCRCRRSNANKKTSDDMGMYKVVPS